ncbi:TPA: protein tyrosine phosphatase [Citrobacter freundii]|nr:protein tyrosine phosphatase [Citrobacter freundii]
MAHRYFILAGLSLFLLLCGPVQATEPVKIVFVDTGNTGRSLTAELMAEKWITEKNLHISVISRGVDRDPFDTHAEENAALLWKERGVEVSNHRAEQLVSNDIRHSDLILTLTKKHKTKVIALFPEAQIKTYTLSEYATGRHTDVEDAWGKPIDFYRSMFRQVEGYIPDAMEKASSIKK